MTCIFLRDVFMANWIAAPSIVKNYIFFSLDKGRQTFYKDCDCTKPKWRKIIKTILLWYESSVGSTKAKIVQEIKRSLPFNIQLGKNV